MHVIDLKKENSLQADNVVKPSKATGVFFTRRRRSREAPKVDVFVSFLF